MLLELTVKNFGIIELIHWQPARGLNVITGETGAGKSLVIDALETLLSAKTDGDVIRHGAENALLEAIFELPGRKLSSNLDELLTSNGLLESDEPLLVISAEIRRQGRSVFRVNGKAVSRGLLNRIGNLLVDIHGQSQHLSLLNRDYHLEFLDAYAHTADLKKEFADKAAHLVRVEQELSAISEQEKEGARQEEFLRFQIDELRSAGLREDEETDLEKERIRHASSEQLKEAAHRAYRAIYGDDSASGTPALEKLGEAVAAMRELAGMDEGLKEQLEYVIEVESGLTDIARDVRNYRDTVEYDPQRLNEVELRLGLIRDLKRKYGQTVTGMLDYLAKAESRLTAIGTSGERRQQLEAEKDSVRREMGDIAARLSGQRVDAAGKLVAAVNDELEELNMPGVRFEVAITRNESGEGIPLPDGKSYAFNREGVDIVDFRASTNPGEPLKPLAVIASTGEISRFMLALKSALAEADNIPVLIFDEIDIGVGGRSGKVVGRKLWSIARNRQAICITHLPQIAVFADSHYSVQKQSAGDRTTSLIMTLLGDELVQEIALMLSGPAHSETAVKNAGELIDEAEAWRKTREDKGI